MANYLHALYHEAGLRNEVPDEKWCPSVQMVVDIRTLKLPGPPPIVQGEDKNHSPADPQRPSHANQLIVGIKAVFKSMVRDDHIHRLGGDLIERGDRLDSPALCNSPRRLVGLNA